MNPNYCGNPVPNSLTPEHRGICPIRKNTATRLINCKAIQPRMTISTLIQLSGSHLTIFTAWSSAQSHISMFRANLRLFNLALHPLIETHVPPSSSSLHFSPNYHCLLQLLEHLQQCFLRWTFKNGSTWQKTVSAGNTVHEVQESAYT